MKTANRALMAFIMICAGLLPGAAWPDSEDQGPGLITSGYLRVRAKSFKDIAPEKGTISWIEHRTRLEPTLALSESFKVHFQLDILEYTDFFNGSTITVTAADLFPFYREYEPEPGSSSDSLLRIVKMRRAWFELLTPFGMFEAGRMPSHWGMGILSNDGNGFRNNFGDSYYGDTFDRILFGTKPMGADSNLLTAIAFDKLSSDNIDSSTDDADEVLLIALYTGKDLNAGAYAVSRNQSSTSTSIWIWDAYIKAVPPPWRLEAELALLSGHTMALTSPVDTGTRVVEQFGAALKAGALFSPVGIYLDAGYASGDGDPLGGNVSNFSFHPDFNVGLILFEEMLALDTARVVRDFEQIQGVLTPGTLNFATKGSVTNAIYLMPSVEYRPIENLKCILAFLWAQSDQPWVNPYLYVIDQESGPKNLRGGPLSKDLGWEADLALKYSAYDGGLVIGLEGGYFKPGKAFDSEQGAADPASTIQLKLTTIF